jgi:hypothetical protein
MQSEPLYNPKGGIPEDRKLDSYCRNKLTSHSILEIPVVTLCTTNFNIKKLCGLPTQCVHVFCMDLPVLNLEGRFVRCRN